MKLDEESLSGFDKFDLILDRCLRTCEALIVVLIVLLVAIVIGSEIYWIISADPASPRQGRFVEVLKTLNDNWKVGLVLLIPLFYRAIRAFLERVEEFGGMKASPRKMKTSDPNKPEREE